MGKMRHKHYDYASGSMLYCVIASCACYNIPFVFDNTAEGILPYMCHLHAVHYYDYSKMSCSSSTRVTYTLYYNASLDGLFGSAAEWYISLGSHATLKHDLIT